MKLSLGGDDALHYFFLPTWSSSDMSDSLSTKPAELPWYEAYPQPSTKTPAQVSRDEVLAWLKEGQRPGKDFLVVDVRKLDHTVCTVRLAGMSQVRCLTAHRAGS
jgi:hypothetical protein